MIQEREILYEGSNFTVYKDGGISGEPNLRSAVYEIALSYANMYEAILKDVDAKIEKIKIQPTLTYIDKTKNEQLKEELQRVKAENEDLKRYEYTYLDKFLDLKQALEEIREIIETRFKPETEYLSLSFKEYDKIIEDIDKIVSEVENDI